MTACRWYRSSECLVHRHGARPSAGVCRLCESEGTNRVLGLGDLLRIVMHRPAKLVGVRNCRCGHRQAALNRLVPLRSQNDG